MKKYKIKIGKINLENQDFIIISDKNLEFHGKIIKGSVNFRVYNESKQEVNISNIEEGDIVKIYTNDQINQNKSDIDKLNKLLTNQNSDNLINTQKNNIIINKILIKNKYVFNSESSEEWDDLS